VFALIGTIFGWIFDAASAIADFITATLWPLVVVIYHWLRTLWWFVSPVWDDVIKPVVEILDGLYDGLKQFLLDHFSWLLPWVQKATDLTRLVYLDIIKPITLAFQYVRNVLDILKALHVPLAAELEADLNKLENKILGPIIDVVNTVNQIADLVQQLILDPAGLLLRHTLLSSLFRDQVYVMRLVFAYALRQPYQHFPAKTDAKYPVRSFDTYANTVISGIDGQDADGGDLIAMAEASFDDFIGATYGGSV